MHRWKNVIIRPGGMHTLMSFIGSIGNLMLGTGRENLLGASFKGVHNMLNGKAWPKALRGMRMVLSVLLEESIRNADYDPKRIQDIIEDMYESPNEKLWMECFVIVFIAHLFIRAECTGDWLLHLYCLRRMLCYFWAAGHFHYARYITWHIQYMDSLEVEAEEYFLSGEHVCRHKDGVWNSVLVTSSENKHI